MFIAAFELAPLISYVALWSGLVLNPNAVKDNAIGKKGSTPANGFIRHKSGVVLPPDGTPPGTMTLRGHDAEVSVTASLQGLHLTRQPS